MTQRIVFIGLSITSSWGNGHATTYRGLLRALDAQGHEVTFLERDVPWYREHRDLPEPPFGETYLYGSLDELDERFRSKVREADAVVIGSFTPDGVAVAQWAFQHTGGVVLFYDIDTPVTMAALERGQCAYLRPSIIRSYDAYVSFTGGPLLDRLRNGMGARAVASLHCAVDPEAYAPSGERPETHTLGYLGTYSPDRQPALERLLVALAAERQDERFLVAGPQYPKDIFWPKNVTRREHVPPAQHVAFYEDQRFTLNITRRDMVVAGYAPSVRLFEAAATGTPIITDDWPGLDTFFRPGEELLVARNIDDVRTAIDETSEAKRRAIGAAARERILAEHTPAHRAHELVDLVSSLLERRLAHA